MASKRKADSKPVKRGRKKKVDEDFESDSDEGSLNGNEDNKKENIEVLIESVEDTRLPDELLKTFDREPGKLMIAGMVTWDLVGRRDTKGTVTVRPNLYTFHRFTDDMVNDLFLFAFFFLFHQ